MNGSTRSTPHARLRKFFAVGAALVTLCVASISNGIASVTYDEKLRSPQDASLPGLQDRARDYFALFSDGSRTMLDVLRDRATYSSWVELRWHLDRALDRGVLGDALAEYGISLNADGSYNVDLERFPQWLPLQGPLSSFLSPANRDDVLRDLESRGLSDADVQSLRAFLEVNQFPTHEGGASRITQDQLSASFATRVKAKQVRGLKLQRAETMSFIYQRFKVMEEESRAWGVGLFDSVDSRGQEILQTFALEHQGVMSMSGSDPEKYLSELEMGFATGAILQRIQADEATQRETR